MIQIAACDASNESKTRAVYVCAGVDDQDIINLALRVGT
jgi:hypothetical protein